MLFYYDVFQHFPNAFYSAINHNDYANHYNLDYAAYWQPIPQSAASKLAQAKDLLSSGQLQSFHPTRSPQADGEGNSQPITATYQAL